MGMQLDVALVLFVFALDEGASWMEKEEDDDPTISSRPGREKEKKMQGLKDKRQATATIGLSAMLVLLFGVGP